MVSSRKVRVADCPGSSAALVLRKGRHRMRCYSATGGARGGMAEQQGRKGRRDKTWQTILQVINRHLC